MVFRIDKEHSCWGGASAEPQVYGVSTYQARGAGGSFLSCAISSSSRLGQWLSPAPRACAINPDRTGVPLRSTPATVFFVNPKNHKKVLWGNESGYSTTVSASLSEAGVPGLVAFDHRIEDGQHLSHAGDYGHLLQFALREQPLVELFDHGVTSRGRKRGHIEWSSDRCATSPTTPFTFVLAAIIVERSHTNELGDLLPRKPT